MGISYSKKLRAIAAGRNMDVFACGFAEAKGKGVSEFSAAMDWRMANALFAFTFSVRSGKTPAEAFAEITWPETTKTGSTPVNQSEGA